MPHQHHSSQAVAAKRKVLRSVLRRVPQKPGVYSFFDARGRLLYVGKASRLKARVQSYLRDQETTSPARAKMLSEISLIRWETVPSEPEALIREAELIKKLKPRYNVLLRDDKDYFFVGLTREPFSRLFLTHQPRTWQTANGQRRQPAKFIGPFTDGSALKDILKALRKAFPYCTCARSHKRPCLSASLGRCLGVCCLKNSGEAGSPRRASAKPAGSPRRSSGEAGGRYRKLRRLYRQNILRLQKTLQGKQRLLQRQLTSAMRQAAKASRFEQAATLRDQLRALEKIFTHRSIIGELDLRQERQEALEALRRLLHLAAPPWRIEAYDISNLQGHWATGSMAVFQAGLPAKSEYRTFRIKTFMGINDVAMMQEVIARRLWHLEPAPGERVRSAPAKHWWTSPDVLAVDGGRGQMEAALAALKQREMPERALPIIGLAKGKNELHYTLPMPGGSVAVKVTPRKRLARSLQHLLAHLQQEAHRFALRYHRKLRHSDFR